MPVASNGKTDLLNPVLTKLGFQELNEEVAYRVVLSTVAPEKTGKTHFAMGVPGPVGVITTDTGTIEVAKQFMRRKKIVVCNFKSAAELIQLHGENKAQPKYESEWERMKDAYMAVISDKRFRSLVFDTGTEGWELCRLAKFGKLTQVMPHHYGPVNSEFRAMIKAAYERSDLNAVFVHKVKKEYKAIGKDGKEVWTGRMERAGFGDMPYLVDVNLRHYFRGAGKDEDDNPTDACFGIEIIDSRINMLGSVGARLEGEFCNFQFLAETLFPDTAGSGMWE